MARKEIYAGEITEIVQFRGPEVTVNNEGGRETEYPEDGQTVNCYGCIRDVDQRRVMEGATDALIDTKELYVRNSINRSVIDKDWIVTNKGTTYIILTKERLNNDNRFLKFIIKVKSVG